MRLQLTKMKKILQHKRVLYIPLFLFLLWFTFCLPDPLFEEPASTVLEDSNGNLLAVRIADDGQWRFPESDSVPEKIEQAILHFEDQYFYSHPGFNPVSMFRALRQNLEAGRVVSGGSTITMQVIRLSRKGQSRTVFEKLIEVIKAVRLELGYSKKEILSLYAAHAPFGGNVVGLETAAWRYFGRSAAQLSWGEATTLAVLPNAPSLIYPGKNQEKLKQKRNRLLDKLHHEGIIDSVSCQLAKEEPLPGKPKAIPLQTPHLLDRLIREGHKGERVRTTIDMELQERVNRLVESYHGALSQNEIHNVAALVLDVEKGTVMAYVGNSDCPQENSGRDVDIITAPRSTGSILKPFLYTFMLQDGVILPNTLIPDVPTQIAGYAPKNFEQTYDGMVKADEALARSLNIPAVRMLQMYGLERFHHRLQKLNLGTINKPAGHYGLSLILGGAEVTLWDIGNEYMKMAQTLNGGNIVQEATYLLQDTTAEGRKLQKPVFDAGALWWTFEALTSLNRPWQEAGWQMYQSSKKIAWKTGTSFGHRDAWAVGITPKHLVAVWVGNADGEGRPGLTGLSVAAPLMFRVFKQLKYDKWFQVPEPGLKPVRICMRSGYLASEICTPVREIMAPDKAGRTSLCPYHELVHLDDSKKYRVTSKCYVVSEMQNEPWFVLPPVPEWYYRRKNPFYRSLPPLKAGCEQETHRNMAVIYPKELTKIFIPRELAGTLGKAVFEIAHRDPEITIYWHLDNTYIGATQELHRMEIAPSTGKHQMVLVDAKGETLSWRFEVLER